MEVIRDMVEVNGMVGRVPREAEVLCTSPNRVKIVLGASEMHAVALYASAALAPWCKTAVSDGHSPTTSNRDEHFSLVWPQTSLRKHIRAYLSPIIQPQKTLRSPPMRPGPSRVATSVRGSQRCDEMFQAHLFRSELISTCLLSTGS